MKSYIGVTLAIFFTLAFLSSSFAQESKRIDTRVREYISPVKVVWLSDTTGRSIKNIESLLRQGNGQSDLINHNLCELINKKKKQTSFLLDFGKELHGGLEIVTGRWRKSGTKKVRIRFGESVSEAMSELEGAANAKNDHAIRDQEVLLPWLGKKEIGNSGFRFVRIDFLEPEGSLFLKEVNAISVYRDIPYLGSFQSNDSLLNKIWETGAYTVHLNMQGYLWDGIKRDRLVWIGDMHPEVMTINSVFGYNEVVPKSLDLIRDNTPTTEWMNGISSYSMWWIMIHYEWYNYHGNLEYLSEQKEYITSLLGRFCELVDDKGKEHLDGNRFLDWPSSPFPKAVDAGYHALLKLTLERGAELCEVLNEKETAKRCMAKASVMSKSYPDPVNSKQAAALLSLADLLPNEKANAILKEGGAKNFSTFYGYYMLEAMAKADEFTPAMEIIRDYWGGMLQLGATTFWEDFNVDWAENAGRIDELPQDDKKDIHADCGDFCYKGLRHSLCHGWASGPTAWLSAHVLGVKVLEPGCKKIKIEPRLGDLKWVNGTFPTPYGVIEIEHRADEHGNIISNIKAPKEVEIVRGGEN